MPGVCNAYLIKKGYDGDIYIIENGQKRKIENSYFNDNVIIDLDNSVEFEDYDINKITISYKYQDPNHVEIIQGSEKVEIFSFDIFF